MTRTATLIAFIISIFSIGNVYANSNIGHNAVGIYCIWKLTTDASFMPEIQGIDRQELTHPNILNCSEWGDLSNAQKAFLQGMNFPDALTFMEPSHNEAPMSILSAMYTLKDICPPEHKARSEADKAFICRMQRYMTWGSKLHIEMDKITHGNDKLPYAGTSDGLVKHVQIERIWDIFLSLEIFEKKMEGSVNVKKLIELSDCVGSLSSKDLRGFDIRDKYIDLILKYYGNTGIRNKIRQATELAPGLEGQFKNLIVDLIGKVLDNKHLPKFLKDKLRNAYFSELHNRLKDLHAEYPVNLADQMIDLVNRINLTKGPTQKEIDEQYNIDLPKHLQDDSHRISEENLARGREMLRKVNELAK